MPILSNFPAGKKVKYNSSLTSDAADEAATPKAVKQVNEKAEANTLNLGGIKETVQTKRTATWGDLLSGLSGIAFLGSGTPEDPYKIYTAAELDNVRNDMAASYILMNDIDLSVIDWQPIGDGTTTFTGTFDGNGYTISNLSIVKESIEEPLNDVGLFRTNSGIISNLRMDNVNIVATTANNIAIYVGGVTGRNYGTITCVCVISGNISGKGNGKVPYAGGVAGAVVSGGTISNCYNRATISAYPANSYGGAGGIAGLITTAKLISNVYNSGLVMHYESAVNNTIGYISRSGNNSIKDVFSVWPSSPYYYKSSSVTLTNCVGLSSSDFGNVDTFDSWDKEVWNVGNGKYPTLHIIRRSDDIYIPTDAPNGSIDRPFEISSLGDLKAMEYYPEANYVVTKDISTSTHAGNTIFADKNNPFTGVLNGNGHAFNTVTWNNSAKDSDDEKYGGIFGFMNGRISDLTVNIWTQNNVNDNINYGTLAGKILENGVVSRIRVGTTNSINYIGGGKTIGGIAAINNGIIEDSLVTIHPGGKRDGTSLSGGIVHTNNGTIENTLYYGEGSRSSNTTAIDAGIAYTNNGSIKSSYALSSQVDCLIKEGTAVESGMLLTATQMKTADNFTGFDFDNVWTMGNTHPELCYPTTKESEASN